MHPFAQQPIVVALDGFGQPLQEQQVEVNLRVVDGFALPGGEAGPQLRGPTTVITTPSNPMARNVTEEHPFGQPPMAPGQHAIFSGLSFGTAGSWVLGPGVRR